MKIIYGWSVNYDGLLENGTIEELQSRRRAACLRFANRALASSRFGSRWFPKNPVSREARTTTRRVYKERLPRTERDKNNPIQNMIRLLNRQSSD